MNDNFTFAFFGSSRFSVIVLDELKKAGLMPRCIVTTPDKPKGRKLVLTPTPVKEWAQAHGISRIFDPAKLDEDFAAKLAAEQCTAFVVASYGKIIPARILDLPPRKTLNIHPSLLPRYRGASPLQSAMLDDAKETGVTIMRLDEQMDHGPLIAQSSVAISEWPAYEEFEEMMAREGARLLARTLPDWIAGKLPETPQDHEAATYTRKITKEDGLIPYPIDALPPAEQYAIFRKIQAFHQWPSAYFFYKDQSGQKDLRVKITAAQFVRSAAHPDGILEIRNVIPEGSSEMPYAEFLRRFGAQ